MKPNRLEAFSDGVVAILITIMVLELKVPHSATLEALTEVWPHFVSYVLSFIYLAIYWNNHHHMIHTVDKVNGRILWANNHLLFWLSLIPFATAWTGESGFQQVPMMAYGAVLLCAGVAYYILQQTIIASQGPNSKLKIAVGSDWKGKTSPVLYVASVGLSAINPWVGFAVLAAVALIWLIPDQRIERLDPD
jgi:TMEM175 potassium channel family protein